jgi:predicted RNA binding protein YcfA (HicA-like mRNA interferase family)
MKISELIRLISRNGCFLLKHKSRHDLWINSNTGETFLIPRHQSEEVPKGLERAAKKWAGIE